MRWGVLAAGLACTLLAAAKGQAQVAIVAVAREDGTLEEVRAAADRAASALDAAGGAVLAAEAAARVFEERHSAPPASVSQSDIDRWLSSSRSAVRNLARADYDAARRDLLAAQELSDRAAEELNREAARARQVLDTCLFMVRSFLETDDAPRAARQARQCRQLVPRVEPSHALHPPEVRELLQRVDHELAGAPASSLEVRSVPGGCTVRLNGLELGTTPYTVQELLPGEYRVQVECEAERRGRVHRLTLEEGETVLEVDALFERAIRSAPGIALAYPDANEADGHRFAHALALARVLDVAEVWLVTPAGGGAAIDRIDARTARVVASVTSDEAGLEDAVAALREGESVRIAGGRRTEAVAWQPPGSGADWSPGPAPTERRPAHDEAGVSAGAWVGLGLSAVGLAGLAAGWGAYAERVTRGDRLAVALPTDPDYLDRQSRWSDARPGVLLFPAAGAAALSAAVPLLLPAEDGVPWWAWASGGVGTAVAATGLGLALAAAPCSTAQRQDQPCVDEAHRRDLGLLVSMHGAPLLAMPITYLLRPLFGSDGGAQAAVGPGGARIGWEGRF